MPRFRLDYECDDGRSFGAASFDAVDVQQALAFIATHYANDAVALWCDEQFLGHLERIDNEGDVFWRLSS